MKALKYSLNRTQSKNNLRHIKNNISSFLKLLEQDDELNKKLCRYLENFTIGISIASIMFFAAYNMPEFLNDYLLTSDVNVTITNSRKNEIDTMDEAEKTGLLEKPYIVPQDVLEYQELINKYSKVYQVDELQIYKYIKEITGNFTIDIKDVKTDIEWKENLLQASSYEELILLAARSANCKPEQLGLDDSINKTQTVLSRLPEEYIAEYAEILEVNKAFVYAIGYIETNYQAGNYVSKNNPGNVYYGGEFVTYDNLDAGFIDMILEIKKFQSDGLNSIVEFRTKYAPKEHITTDCVIKCIKYGYPLQGNPLWIDLFVERYLYAIENYVELFGQEAYEKDKEFLEEDTKRLMNGYSPQAEVLYTNDQILDLAEEYGFSAYEYFGIEFECLDDSKNLGT